jgi:large subunit ribosomal protein L3
MRELIGRKVGMTRLFDADGTAVPVTVISAGPCVVVSTCTAETHGYASLRVGYGDIKASKVTRPVGGQFAKAGVTPTRMLTEVAVPPGFAGQPGDRLTVELFTVGEKVNVTGVSIGKGWQGVMKRHHFGGVGGTTHGQSDRLRAPGSIGASSYPSRVFKGQRMAGQMGGRTTTVKNLVVVAVDPEKALILLRGAVPGKADSLVRIKGS